MSSVSYVVLVVLVALGGYTVVRMIRSWKTLGRRGDAGEP